MIVFEDNVETVKVNGVLYSQPDTVRKLAVMMMVNAAEGNTDMVLDMQHEYPSKADVEAAFKDLNELALDCLEDHISDLRLALKQFLENAKVTARVRRLEYDTDGNLADIVVDVDVK